MSILEKTELALLEAVPMPLAVFDRAARLIASSPAYATLTGLDPAWLARGPAWGELVARLRAERQLPEVADPAAWREEERRRLTSLDCTLEERLYLPDGRTLSRTATPLAAGGFILAFADVTERLAAERAANEATLVQRQTLDHLSDALAVFGADGRLKFANNAFRELWTWDGQRLGDFVQAVELPWSVARILAREAETVRIVRPDGALFDAHHAPLPDGAALLRFANVTDAAKLEDALRARAEATAAASRMKSEFVATLAYEAGKPLAQIADTAALLANDHVGALSRRQADYATTIVAAAQQLARMVEDILDLASIEAGMSGLERAPFDLHAALASLVAAVSERARAARLALEFDCPPDIGLFDGDAKRIRQAVLHLVNNAITFTPGGGRVAIAAKRRKDAIEISVADTGVGIRRAELPRVQEPFARGSDVGTAGAGHTGSGLGLTLVRRFVELHGGAVEISSIRHRGTTVLLRLPVGGPTG